MSKDCELCATAGGTLLWQNSQCRVVRVLDADYPGFCRVIWQAHVREMTDLAETERLLVMQIVFAVESVVRKLFSPHKINLASFGNMTPHLHWHIIPRWPDDKHFPEPVWGKIQREKSHEPPEISDVMLTAALQEALVDFELETKTK